MKLLPIFAMVALVLVITLLLVSFGASMASVSAETNATTDNATMATYMTQEAWYGGLSLLVLVLAVGFVLWKFFVK